MIAESLQGDRHDIRNYDDKPEKDASSYYSDRFHLCGTKQKQYVGLLIHERSVKDASRVMVY